MLYKVNLLSFDWLTMNLTDAMRRFFLCQSFLNFHFILIRLKIRKSSKGIGLFRLLKVLIKDILFKEEIVLLFVGANLNSTFDSSNMMFICILFWFNFSGVWSFLSCSARTSFFHILAFTPFEYFQNLWLRVT